MKRPLTESEHALIKAISDGSFERVVDLLSSSSNSIDLNCTDEHGMSPLQHACYKGNVEIARYLLERGADVNQNDHEHRYTALMFAALGGYTPVITLLLEHGAHVHTVNSVGRNAAQMAAFVGQHQSVAVINNYLPRDWVEYYSKITGLETEPRLPARFIQPVHALVRTVNIHPVRIAYFFRSNQSLFDEFKKVSNVLELLCEKLFRCKEANEVFSMKVHYLNFVFTYLHDAWKRVKVKPQPGQDHAASLDSAIGSVIKSLLKENDNCFLEAMERLLRESVRLYPYQENSLFQQLVRTLATVEIGDEPSALSILSQAILGKAVASEDLNHCFTCGEFDPDKRCSKCKVATYCDRNCQKAHWFVHKNSCQELLQQSLKRQELLAKEQEKADREAEINKSDNGTSHQDSNSHSQAKEESTSAE